MTDNQKAREAMTRFEADLDAFVSASQDAGTYMPSLATLLRLHADCLADRFPDDTNQSERTFQRSHQ